jgi:SAM-dependent methyltransferase
MTRAIPSSCPACGAGGLHDRGPILHPDPPMVAGVPIDLPRGAHRLVACRPCGFQFKHPPIDPSLLLQCYTAAAADHWGESPDPTLRRFDAIQDALEHHARGGRVLDVGCFNGALLHFLGDDRRLYGVEPSHHAARLAAARGVRILGPTVQEIPAGTEPFDAVLAIDVIEHVGDPRTLVAQLASLLRPGGVLVLLTGNTDSWAWRLQGSRYWYCSLPEHVSFFNRRSLDSLARGCGLTMVECQPVRHKRLGLSYWSRDALKSFIFIAGRATGGFGLPRLRRLCCERRGPTIQSAKDHVLCVLRREHGR